MTSWSDGKDQNHRSGCHKLKLYLGSVSLGIGGWRKKEKEKVIATSNQSVGPTKSKIFSSYQNWKQVPNMPS